MYVSQVLGVPHAPDAIFVDEHDNLTIHGDAFHVGSSMTVISSRRHALSKTFGDLRPADLQELLNSDSLPRDRTVADSYSVVGVEVWGYGVGDVADLIQGLNASLVQVLPLSQYLACMREHVTALQGSPGRGQAHRSWQEAPGAVPHQSAAPSSGHIRGRGTIHRADT